MWKNLIAKKRYRKGNSVEDIAEILYIPVKEVTPWYGLVRT